jgi:tetratricopeptide (TPR) repeat protein
MDAQLFYQLLIGEMQLQSNDPATGFALLLDAARKTNDAALFRRATDIALQARAGDDALAAARAWQQALPESPEANQYVLQILAALGRFEAMVEPLQRELQRVGAEQRRGLLGQLPRLFARMQNRPQAAALAERVVGDWRNRPDTAAVAWSVLGHFRFSAQDRPGALEAARSAQAADAASPAPALLAIDLISAGVPTAQALLDRYLSSQPNDSLVRLQWARSLMESMRYAEAITVLEQVTTSQPSAGEAWLLLGTLRVQSQLPREGEAALQQYLRLAEGGGASSELARGLPQAYLSLAQAAEQRRDFAAVERWLGRVGGADNALAVQTRRASALAKQGRMAEARALVQSLPARTAAERRAKVGAEAQILRDAKLWQQTYDLLKPASAAAPDDMDLLYDFAMAAEKLNRLDEMEAALRRVIATRPDYHHAYNALGYSLADRNLRLPEARQLIVKALEFAPNDPFIIDSLAWVEFRSGNTAEALRLLEQAYRARPDAEIAAHLGEVLWTLGRRDEARRFWREGLTKDADNDTLKETLKRFNITAP